MGYVNFLEGNMFLYHFVQSIFRQFFFATENTTDFPQKGSFLEGKMGPRKFQGTLGYREILQFSQNPLSFGELTQNN